LQTAVLFLGPKTRWGFSAFAQAISGFHCIPGASNVGIISKMEDYSQPDQGWNFDDNNLSMEGDEPMPTGRPRTKAEAINFVIAELQELDKQQKEFLKRLGIIRTLLTMVITESDLDDDVNMDTRVPDTGAKPRYRTVTKDGKKFTIDTTVEIKDTKNGWVSQDDNHVGKITKLLEERLYVRLNNGNTTWRKYKNARPIDV
jgi:hypothetical protein